MKASDDPQYARNQKILELMRRVELGEITEEQATDYLNQFDRDNQTVSNQA